MSDRIGASTLDALAQPLDEDVVAPLPTTVHADLDPVAAQLVDELCPGELAALIGDHDLGFAVACDGLLQRFDAEVGLHRDGQPMREHSAAVQSRIAVRKTKPRAIGM